MATSALSLFSHVWLRRAIGPAPEGARGSIVMAGPGGYEVEVFDEHGEMIDVLPASAEDLEPDE